ncbi:SRPBCC family protein [Leucobacter sp. HNU]|uniref:SRPBCC family protein n=1 Tax=Leucobacter sp. HNU TaxID=3236805 RepID=UPI003A7FA312
MSPNYTAEITVAATSQEAYDAILRVPDWWGRITGTTTAVGDEFVYVVPGLHYSGFRVTELEPGCRVAWLVTGSHLDFVSDTQEWTGTTVAFDISPAADGTGTTVVFAHEGLTPEVECYEVCTNAWSMFVTGSLKSLIETGAGQPYDFDGTEALTSDDHEDLHRGVREALASGADGGAAAAGRGA